MSKNLGIVICNFNKQDYLKNCIDSFYKSELFDLNYDLIVVDNASSDDSVNLIKTNYQDIILLENKINTGGSGGFDRGIQYCIKKEYEHVVLLDNDILLEKDTIYKLYEYIKKNTNVGVVGSKICTMDNPDILQELGSFIDFDETFNVITPFKGHKDDSSLPEVVNCDYVPACCLITTKEVLNKVGGFNTDHFIYWDDMDWCTRIKKANYEIHSINSSRVFHKMGVSNHTNTFGVYYFERNKIMFFLKHLKNEKLEDFFQSMMKWLLSFTFFSNEKESYASAVSILIGLDDLLTTNLGRQDKSILVKEVEIDIFKKYNFKKDDKVAIILKGNMNSSRRVYNYLSSFYLNPIDIIDLENTESIKNSFAGNIVGKMEMDKYDVIFTIYNHILDFNNSDLIKNSYYIDAYLNISREDSIKNLIISYENYEKLFQGIFQPMIINKLKRIRNNFVKSI